MIRIVNTNKNRLQSNYNGEWRNSQSAQRLIGDQVCGDTSCSTPQANVDAIAAAMDQPEATITPETQEYHPQQPLMSAKEQDIAIMMQNYIRQNGGVVQDNDNKPKNQTLFG